MPGALQALCDLTKAVDALVDAGPGLFYDQESVVGLERELARLEAVVCQSVAEFDTWGEWTDSGAKAAWSWLAARCSLSASAAKRQVRLGGVAQALPAFGRGWQQGRLTGAHLDAVAAVKNPATEAALERDQTLLADQAAALGVAEFGRAMAYWGQLADPEGAEERAQAQRTRRDVFLTESFDGMYLGQMTLDPVSGTIVKNELSVLEEALFAQDRDEAKERLGKDPTMKDLARTPAQRRADALVEMARRSASLPGTARPSRPLFSVLVDFPTLCGRICEMEGGPVVTPGTVVSWMGEADFERAVFTPPNRVDVSCTSRFFTGATRRALELRDRVCAHPYCERPARYCEADHIVGWAQGGPTTQDNGRLLCAFHNRLRNRRDWERPPPAGEG